eukprot:1394352-Amorphochlora_amoeboformis.AAC.1
MYLTPIPTPTPTPIEDFGRSKGMELIRYSKVMARKNSINGKWEVVRASQPLQSGRHYFEVELIERDLDMAEVYARYKKKDIIMVGIIDSKFNLSHANLRLGQPQKAKQHYANFRYTNHTGLIFCRTKLNENTQYIRKESTCKQWTGREQTPP